jgi:hypothetical protein
MAKELTPEEKDQINRFYAIFGMTTEDFDIVQIFGSVEFSVMQLLRDRSDSFREGFQLGKEFAEDWGSESRELIIRNVDNLDDRLFDLGDKKFLEMNTLTGDQTVDWHHGFLSGVAIYVHEFMAYFVPLEMEDGSEIKLMPEVHEYGQG